MAKRIEKWVYVPVRFWISAKDQVAFDKAMLTLPSHVWHSQLSSEGYLVESERAKED
jgi:hypothetical protein